MEMIYLWISRKPSNVEYVANGNASYEKDPKPKTKFDQGFKVRTIVLIKLHPRFLAESSECLHVLFVL